MKTLVKLSIILLLVWAVISYVLYCCECGVVFLSQSIIGAVLAIVILHTKYQLVK